MNSEWLAFIVPCIDLTQIAPHTVGILQCDPIQFTKTDQSDCMK